VKAHKFSMPGYRFHLVYVTPHPRGAYAATAKRDR
jgi:hypothetical protein